MVLDIKILLILKTYGDFVGNKIKGSFLFFCVVDHIKYETYCISARGHHAYFLLELVLNRSFIAPLLLLPSHLLATQTFGERIFHIQNREQSSVHTHGRRTLYCRKTKVFKEREDLAAFTTDNDKCSSLDDMN